MKCPSMDELMTYSRGGLTSAERALIVSHLATGCGSCETNQRWLAEATDLAATEPVGDVSDVIVKSMVNWFKALPARETRSLPRVLASLIFDSLTSSQPLAVRRDQVGRPCERQLLFNVEGYEIDLRFESSGPGEMLVGQILPEGGGMLPPGAAMVRLSRAGETISSATSEADGVFRLRDIESGIYDLHLVCNDREIVLEQVATAQAR